MQLKQFYNIATKVSSKKNATTFGDLPDWWSNFEVYRHIEYINALLTIAVITTKYSIINSLHIAGAIW